ncbi:MAG: hypothetical protein DBY34_02145 [Oscillospiraceae bacterium]|nr:MAG: hypothetical protein DBY34_02145 [Oscillospiraceae bacterium]
MISALPDRKQDAAAFKKRGRLCGKKAAPTWKHAASSREPSQKRGLLGKEFCKRGQKAHGIPGGTCISS